MSSIPRTSSASPVSFGAIVLGALICVALLLLLAALASGAGLAAFDLEQGELPGAGLGWAAAAYGSIGLLVAFFIGGFVSARASLQTERSGSLWHGLGSWSLVVVAAALIVGNLAGSAGAFLARAGIGAGAAVGAAGSLDQVSERLGKLRIVTDLSLIKGKAVTQFVIPESGQQLAGIAAREIPKELKSAKKNLAPSRQGERELKEAAGTAREAVAGASFAAFAVILLGAIAAALGGLYGRRFASAATGREV